MQTSVKAKKMKKRKLFQLVAIVTALTLGILMIWQPNSAYAYSGTCPNGNGLFVLYYGFIQPPASEDSTLKTIMSKQPNFVIFGDGLQDRGDIPNYVHQNNGRAIQYIPLNYGKEASDVVDTKITTAMKAGYDGIFFDETDAAKADWNALRVQKVRQFGATKLVVVNPGVASPPSSVFDYADIVSVENQYNQKLPSYPGIKSWRWLAVQGDPANQAAPSAEEAFNRRKIFQKDGGFWYYSSNQQATGATHINLPPWYEKFADLVKDQASLNCSTP
ncbi:MAG: spherulation-specific family 4 protein [Heteroscytonema crispum UTEX LB 1556]